MPIVKVNLDVSQRYDDVEVDLDNYEPDLSPAEYARRIFDGVRSGDISIMQNLSDIWIDAIEVMFPDGSKLRFLSNQRMTIQNL